MLPIAAETASLFVGRSSITGAVAWTGYLVPLSAALWAAVAVISVACGTFLALLVSIKGDQESPSVLGHLRGWIGDIWNVLCTFFARTSGLPNAVS